YVEQFLAPTLESTIPSWLISQQIYAGAREAIAAWGASLPGQPTHSGMQSPASSATLIATNAPTSKATNRTRRPSAPLNVGSVRCDGGLRPHREDQRRAAP